MVAVGPIFLEQKTMDQHRPIRDQVAALETGMALLLRSRGYEVIGTHGVNEVVDAELWNEVLGAVDDKFPPLQEVQRDKPAAAVVG
jgi:hypothetical protein